MDLHFGAAVLDRDSAKLGALQRVVVDPETRELVSLVVLQSRAPGDEVVVAVGAVDTADDSAVQLSQSSEQFADAEPFILGTINSAPAPTADEVDSDLIKEPVDVPDVPPIGAATGVESIAFTPILEEEVNVPPEDVVLSASTEIYATDGELGTLHHVVTNDDTNELFSVVAERHGIFTHPVEIPGEWITVIRSEALVLSVDAATVADANRD